MELSIAIPCFNEEGCIEEVIVSWMNEISHRLSSFQMILVDDGSTDSTPSILERLKSKYPNLKVVTQRNQGHGPARLAGLLAGEGEWLFHTDSDLQFSPKDFWKLWDLRTTTPVVMGQRKPRRDPPHRLWISAFLSGMTRLLSGLKVKDVNIPYTLFRRDVAEKVFKVIPARVVNPGVILVIAAHKLQFPISQVPIQHFPRTTGKSILGPLRLTKDCLQTFWSVIRFSCSPRAR